MRGLRPGRPAVVVGGLGTAAVAAVVCTLVLGSRGAMIASVLGSLATVASLFVTITGVRARSVTNDRLLDTARQLARKVRSQEAEVLARLVADSGDPEPADVSFTQPALIYWRVDGGDRRGTLSEIKGYYRSLDRGRLVVLGEPGAGKTVLAIQLVLDLTAVVLDLADGGPPLPRVPVRLSLPAFDPGGDSDLAAAKVLSTKLDDWLVRHLVTAFGLTAAVAAALVTGGWILPILDGLDEMDRDDAAPRRAASVIRAVNHPSAGGVRPVVITCRTNRYQQLSGRVEAPPNEQRTTSNAGRREVVQDATVVDVEPLSGPSVVRYLTYRFPDPGDRTRVESRWRPIVERLTAGNGGGEPLAAALGSPLRLFLTVTAYRDDTSKRKHSAGTRWCSGWWHGVMTGGLVSAGWVYRGLPGQAGAGSGGIHGRPT
ncbi:MAG: NACHT domain-containing protein, partial [Pseudonocardiales bacterium]|nr:NACHT domain-containing protein [Pseudonocardiales bacterium]MBV9032759.1 NACHT domain-containing protein [Pseudonocardiales bacterium]